MEIKAEQKDLPRITSIYFGGGTPLVIGGQRLVEILNRLKKNFSFSQKLEISIEVNPEDAKLEAFLQLQKAGFNRISIGAQSFDDQILSLIGRAHTADQIKGCFKLARQAGFGNINLDLIFGLPNQNLDTWQADIEAAISMGPEHLSIYSLTIERKTKLAILVKKGKLEIANEETQAEMYSFACRLLKGEGYHRYEISNFSQEGFCCQHNLLYWKQDEYLGLGAGAHSYINGLRFWNGWSVRRYIKRLSGNQDPISGIEHLSKKAKFGEAMFLGLRLQKGVNLTELMAREDICLPETIDETIKELVGHGLLYRNNYNIGLTEKGMLLANQVCQEFIYP